MKTVMVMGLFVSNALTNRKPKSSLKLFVKRQFQNLFSSFLAVFVFVTGQYFTLDFDITYGDFLFRDFYLFGMSLLVYPLIASARGFVRLYREEKQKDLQAHLTSNRTFVRGVEVEPLNSYQEAVYRSNLTPSRPMQLGLEKPLRMKSFDAHEYEIYCAAWLKNLGANNVRLTNKGADGGVDIVSDRYEAQVKFHGKPITVNPIREIFGVAAAQSKHAIFFASAGYTPAAVAFAEKNKILLFVCDPLKETLIAATRESQRALEQGLQ